MAAGELEEAREKLEHEFNQVRSHLGRIWDVLREIERAGPEDDLYGMLGKLEDRVKEVRTGGIIGSGAHGHRRALKHYKDVKPGD